MEKNETFRKLCERVNNEILSYSTITKFYIGKTDNIEERSSDHKLHDFQETYPIATGEPETINDAEKYAIAYFKEKDAQRIANVGSGGEGPDGTILYIALMYEIEVIEELSDMDIVFNPIKI